VSAHASHTPTREELVQAVSNKPVSATLKLACLVLAALGTALFAYGAVTGSDRAWLSLQYNWLYFTIISSAGVVFAAVQRLTTARWSRSVVRIVEGFVAWLPIAFVIQLLFLFPGAKHIYSWAKESVQVHNKALYLDPTFFRLRGILLFGAITVFSLWFVYLSTRLDVGVMPEQGAGWARGIRDRMRRGFRDERRELHTTHSVLGKISVVLVMLFGYGWVVMAWDYSMTISLHFQSTMYGWQVFMGAWLIMIMALAALMRFWRNQLGVQHLIGESHFHDVGKLAFAFTAFWGYLTFSQYLVIWYGNLPEETHFFRLRLMDPWQGITTAIAVMVFVIPFFTLLSKAAKLYSPVMLTIAAISAVGIWLHRFVEIYPSVYGPDRGVPLGLYEIGVGLGMLGLWGFAYLSFMDAFPKMRVFMMTSPHRDEVQVPVDPRTMEPLPAHE
jgi:hypothetical protein